MPGFESRLYLVEYPPGKEADLHVHTEQCVGYVMDGRFESAFGHGSVATIRAGEAFVDLPHEPHRFRNADPVRGLRFVLAGTFRKDEPLFYPVQGATGFTPAPAGFFPDERASAADGIRSPETGSAEVKRTLLAERDIDDLSGFESRIYLIEFPPAAESKPHLHTVQGVGYVLDGRFESSFGDGPTSVTRAGEAFVDVPGKVHHFRNPDSSHPLRFVIAGTFHKGEPLFQLTH